MNPLAVQVQDRATRALCAITPSSYLVGGAESIQRYSVCDNEFTLEKSWGISEPVWSLLTTDNQLIAVTAKQTDGHSISSLLLSEGCPNAEKQIELDFNGQVDSIAVIDNRIAVCSNDVITLYSSFNKECTIALNTCKRAAFGRGASSDIMAGTLIVTAGSSLNVIDPRSASIVCKKTNAHLFDISSIDASSNYIVSGCQEGIIKFWDPRKWEKSLLTLTGGHNHWISSIKVNPKYQQLVVSAGTECSVNLWRAPTAQGGYIGKSHSLLNSSTVNSMTQHRASGGSTPGSSIGFVRDGIVEASRNAHEDSIYGLAWSTEHPWSFASLSFDGKLISWSVPKEEQTRISN